ncbi:efflux RND transporter periplasmic adaptor subunit [Micromonospora sp. CB01531]|uniref:efflux RND transporter periplasmic adaptor subunit n=1 Tax=Micromonospora sp. CB01531 TaxID=1718947 RepID=UPI00093C5B9E|nr:biotin/lipoyl-binding protein [Micromonospora sp. CB01531]OKI53787.1 hypothetical protein A6A27_32240 [Micromonospora sp. CB01531]
MRVRLPAVLHRPPVAVNTALALLLLGGGYWAWSSVAGDSAAQAEPARGTRTVLVSRGTVTATVTADGSIESATTASASFATAGTVTDIRVRVGQYVKKGQLLATADPAAAERALKVAQANLDAAEDALDRAADGDTSSAENAVTQAELAVDEAKAAVAGTKLTAPMAGTVVAVNGTVGSSSGGSGSGPSGSSGGQQNGGGSGTTAGFVDLADLSHLQVSAAVAEADATRLKSGLAATVTWNALSDARATGKVVAIDPQATTSNNVVTYGVTISLDGLPTGAKPGQTVTVSVVTGTVRDVLMVNSAAVSGSGDRHNVTVVTETGQEVRRVQVGLAGNQAYEITSGLTEGDRVVLPDTGTGTGSNGGGLRGGAGFPGGGGVPGGGGFPGAGQGGRRTGNGGG